MKLKIVLFSLLAFLSLELLAQDKHFTLFNMAPLRINPANTGAFEGTVRVGGIYRDQFRSALSSAAFTTPHFYADSPLLMLGKRNWLGVGALLYTDRAGSGGLGETSFMISAAIHRMMNKKGTSVITLGAQYGSIQRGFSKFENFEWFDALENNSATTETLSDMTESSHSDVALGLLFKTETSKTSELKLGLSFNHLLRPNYALNGTGGSTPNPNPNPSPGGNNGPDNEKRPILTVIHGEFNAQLNDKLSFDPTFLVQTTSGTPIELVLQAWAGYMLKPEKDIRLNFGLGYRINDAGQVLLGMDFGDLRAALSYDITLSSLAPEVTNYQGGFELSAYYIFKVFKKPEVKPAILCPQL